ncbi:hypothetical protein [Herbaspirillum robiniae]|uniref:Uncharacterized protein n=1 Tax=Herbaspirillum robiniae TaxID=2014887 RepID=A0ABX2M8H5_9BURK|nr:hypothetical protein [Herbaspirillum robiniae]NUU04134.1 hypothetical protein [Herbaspirillum robiniae]
MFITLPSWQVQGVPRTLLAPAVPWRSALLDVSQPCFLVAPSHDSAVPQTHVRLFSDIDELLVHVRGERNDGCEVYALTCQDEGLCVSVVSGIGSYPCPQTGIKLRVFFDGSDRPRPAHSGQPQFYSQLLFEIEAKFAKVE